jgi:glycine/D-amino acid oxidase-like deaminating enzyme
VTRNTTAKITSQHGLIYKQLLRRFGAEPARLYFDANQDALAQYQALSQQIDCDFEMRDSYVYSTNDARSIQKEVAALNRLGADATFSGVSALPFSVAGAVRVTDQAQFHPLKFLYTIARDLPIFEETKVLELKPNKAVTRHGEISYKKLIMATHFPILNKHGLFPLKLYQHRSYVLAIEGADAPDEMYVDACDTGLSLRTWGDLLLLGGGGHRTGKSGGCWQELEEFAERHYKNATIVRRWATQDCMTLDGIPYIGQYAKSTPDLFVATGFNKWGMTNAMVASDLLCDLVRGKQNPLTELFSPSRSLLRPQLAVNACESIVGLLTPTAPRCPHLGCALKYNRAEHSWDCPCHGSRFTEEGELINNPATDDHRSMN